MDTQERYWEDDQHDKVGLEVEHLLFLFPSIWPARDPKSFKNVIVTYLSFLYNTITYKKLKILQL